MSGVLDTILAVAGTFSFLACVISGWLIRQHFLSFTDAEVQSKIVGILWMVPIYCVDSYLGILIPEWALYIDMLRDCYEAYVLYLFLALMLSFLGCDDDESALIFYLENGAVDSSGNPKKVLKNGREFLRYCKFGTLQYCVVRPLVTLVAILLALGGFYDDAGWYITLNVVLNISVFYAFIALGNFYHRFHDKLAPYDPLPKFLCIKFVIFFAFWQGVAINICIYYGVLKGRGDYTTEMVAATLQDFLICIEMFLVAIGYLFAFSAEPYQESGSQASYKSLYSNDQEDPPDAAARIPMRNYTPPDNSASTGSKTTRQNLLARTEENYFGSALGGGISAADYDYDDEDGDDVVLTMRDGGHSRKHPSRQRGPNSSSVAGAGRSSVLDANFATSAAIRDFNASMPVVHLPSNFKPAAQGVSIRSDPRERL